LAIAWPILEANGAIFFFGVQGFIEVFEIFGSNLIHTAIGDGFDHVFDSDIFFFSRIGSMPGQ